MECKKKPPCARRAGGFFATKEASTKSVEKRSGLVPLAHSLAPPQWKWPIIGVIAFFAFFISTRIIARLIGEETERRFNDKR